MGDLKLSPGGAIHNRDQLYRDDGDGTHSEARTANLRGWDTTDLAWNKLPVDHATGALKVYDMSAGGGGGGGSVTQGTSPWVVSAASLPLPTGAAKDSTLTDGTLRVGGTVAVTGTFWQSVQPISDNSGSLTVDNNGTFAVQSTLAAGTAVIGHVIVDTAPTTAVTGTFWQSIQPVSGTVSANATLTAETTKVIGTVNQGTSPWVTSRNWTLASGTDSISASVSNFPASTAVTQSTSPWVVDPSAVTSPVSVTSLPLPSGAATDAKLTTIAAHLAAIRDSVNDLALAAILTTEGV